MTVMAAITLLGGLATTLLAAIVNRYHWSPERKQAVAAGIAVVAGVLACIVNGSIDGIPTWVGAKVAQWVVIIGGVIVTAQGFYRAFQIPIKSLEQATSPKDATGS